MFRLIFTFTFFIVMSAQAQLENVPLFDKLLYISKDDTLPYRLLKPVNPQSKKTFPLVIFMHGAGERGNNNEAQLKHIKEPFLDVNNRARFSCYVIAPQCPKNIMWSNHQGSGSGIRMREKPSEPMRLLIELIAKIEKEFPIDKARIYVIGLSMGGYGTWDLLARFPNRFAAAVPICGGGDITQAQKLKHIPVWAFHGAKDKIVPPFQSRIMVKALQEAGGIPGYTEYPDIEHDSWVWAFREPHLFPWLFEQQLANDKTTNN